MQAWKNLSIKNKLLVYAGTMLLFIGVVVLFDVWIVKYFVADFNRILDNNATCGTLLATLENETAAFQSYIHNPSATGKKDLQDSIKETHQALNAVRLSYSPEDEDRYAQLQAIRIAYEYYEDSRDHLIEIGHSEEKYVTELYRVYSMQNYLKQYVNKYLLATIESGNMQYKELLPNFTIIVLIAFIMSVLSAVAMMESARLLNHSLMDPIIKLVETSKRIASNDFFVDDVVCDNEDELGELVHAFNKMKYATGEYIMALEEKREALDRLHAQEIEQLKTEKQLEQVNLEMLKNQIHPHFLFNTLNVISGMAELEEAPSTGKMITALSSLFRYNLKTQQTEVYLNQELKVANDYMYLQQMRFGDRVKFRVECNVDANIVFIPNFTMQPLLENAMIHGLGPKEAGGTVDVCIDAWEDTEHGRILHIQVKDSGAGMSEEELKRVRKALKSDTETGVGIGLSNICKRIYSMYDWCDMDVESTLGKGTCVEVRIPYHTTPI